MTLESGYRVTRGWIGEVYPCSTLLCSGCCLGMGCVAALRSACICVTGLSHERRGCTRPRRDGAGQEKERKEGRIRRWKEQKDEAETNLPSRT
jgi:hypothetical protein